LHDPSAGTVRLSLPECRADRCGQEVVVDGTGYPRGLRGQEIPLEGRIATVADVFDALTQDRPYRVALPVDEAVEIIVDGSGKKFDPVVVSVLLAVLDEIPPVQKAREEASAA
jgi:putative two-component system response regulator